jgi:hypothetical protein
MPTTSPLLYNFVFHPLSFSFKYNIGLLTISKPK